MVHPPLAAAAALLVAVDGYGMPRNAGLALGKRMYLAGSSPPIVFDRHPDIQTLLCQTFVFILPTSPALRHCSACVAPV
jgi:hypothetical protein